MMQFKSIKSRLLFWFLIISLTPLIFITIMVYFQRSRAIKRRESQKLMAIRDLKILQINQWLDERIGDLHVITNDIELQKLLVQDDITEYEYEVIEKMFVRYATYYAAYSEVFLVNAQTGKIEVSTDRLHRNMVIDKREPYFHEALKRSDVYIKQIYLSSYTHHPSMTFSKTIFNGDNEIFGVIVARIDLINSIYPILQDNTGTGKTGETLIVDHKFYALNELKFISDAPFNLKLNTKPTQKAINAETGIIVTNDYRGRKVLAAYSYIPRTQWGIIVKEDYADIYAPINAMLIQLIILFFIALLIVIITALVVSRKISAPIIEIKRVCDQIEVGDYTIRNSIRRLDELGILSVSINNMADSIERLQKQLLKEKELLEVKVAERTRELHNHQDKLRKLNFHLQNVREEERKKLSRKVHDDVGQLFTAIKMDLVWLQKSIPRDCDDIINKISSINRIANTGIEIVHQISSELRSRILDDFGIVDAMEWYIDRFEERSGITCHYCFNDVSKELKQNKTDVFFSIFKELMTNIVRHSQAENVHVDFHHYDTIVTLKIVDDGIGISLYDIHNPTSFGIVGIREQVHQLGGKIHIEGKENEGTSVVVTIPHDVTNKEVL